MNQKKERDERMESMDSPRSGTRKEAMANHHEMPKARMEVKHPYLVMAGLYVGGFIGMFSETSLNIALPVLSQTFGLDTSVTQWLVTGYMLVIGMVLPFASLLMKWFSTRRLTCFALGMFLVGALVSGFAPSFPVLLAGRLVQGVGTGLILPMMFAVVLEVFPPHKLGSAMGLTALIVMFAPAIGPTLSGFVLEALSWRWLFFLFGGILLVGLLFTLKFMVNPYTLTKPHIDVVSCVTSCLGFGGIVLGVGLASSLGWSSPEVLGSLLIGVLALAIYGKRQLTMTQPVLNLHAFKIRQFAVGTALMTLNFGITLSAMYLFPQYLQQGAGYAVAVTGMIMLPGGIVNALVSLFAGRLYDRIGAWLPTKLGFGLSILGAVLLLLANENSSIAYIICCHIVLMVGVPLAMSPSQSNALNALPAQMSTDGSTILNTMQQVLGAVCTAVATALLGMGQSSYTGASGIGSAEAFVNGVHFGFVFTLILAIAGFVVSFGIKRQTRKQEERRKVSVDHSAVVMNTQSSEEGMAN